MDLGQNLRQTKGSQHMSGLASEWTGPPKTPDFGERQSRHQKIGRKIFTSFDRYEIFQNTWTLSTNTLWNDPSPPSHTLFAAQPPSIATISPCSKTTQTGSERRLSTPKNTPNRAPISASRRSQIGPNHALTRCHLTQKWGLNGLVFRPPWASDRPQNQPQCRA